MHSRKLGLRGFTLIASLMLLMIMSGVAIALLMMVNTEGEDYMAMAEAKGLPERLIFFRYALRNAILPQFTSLAIALGAVVSGSVLVEVVFGLPGIGTLLYKSITGSDFFVIYGIVFVIIFAIALATLVIDLVYPLLDPRISYRNT